jgi:hypothetical protein
VADADAACGEEQPGIAVIEDELTSRTRSSARATWTTTSTCRRNRACAAFKSLVVINRPTSPRLGAEEQANVLAHEIGTPSAWPTHGRVRRHDHVEDALPLPMTLVAPMTSPASTARSSPGDARHKKPRRGRMLFGVDARALPLPSLISVLAEGWYDGPAAARRPGVFLER